MAFEARPEQAFQPHRQQSTGSRREGEMGLPRDGQGQQLTVQLQAQAVERAATGVGCVVLEFGWGPLTVSIGIHGGQLGECRDLGRVDDVPQLCAVCANGHRNRTVDRVVPERMSRLPGQHLPEAGRPPNRGQ